MAGNKARVLHSQLEQFDDKDWTARFSELNGEQMDEEGELLEIQNRLDELEEHSEDSYFEEGFWG